MINKGDILIWTEQDSLIPWGREGSTPDDIDWVIAEPEDVGLVLRRCCNSSTNPWLIVLIHGRECFMIANEQKIKVERGKA